MTSSDRPLIALEELHRRAKRYRLDDALAKVGRIYMAFSDDENREKLPKQQQALWPANVTPHQMAYIAKALIEAANDYKAKVFSFDDYLACARLYNSAQGGEMSGSDDPASWELFFVRTAFQQFPLQAHRWSRIARALFMFADPQPVTVVQPGNRYSSSISRACGHGRRNLHASWVCCLHEDRHQRRHAPFAFDPDYLIRPEVSMANEKTIHGFLALASADYARFREECSRTRPSDTKVGDLRLQPARSLADHSNEARGVRSARFRFFVDRVASAFTTTCSMPTVRRLQERSATYSSTTRAKSLATCTSLPNSCPSARMERKGT